MLWQVLQTLNIIHIWERGNFDDQGNTGTCYAYAITMAMNMNVYHNTGTPVDITEGSIISRFGGNGSHIDYVWNDYLRYGNGLQDRDGNTWYANQCLTVPQDIASTKNAIINYGGVYASVNWSGNVATSGSNVVVGNTTYYNSNHAVCLIGWNDNYSYKNFPESWGITQNGAFIAYNSNRENNNFFAYISYQDANVTQGGRVLVTSNTPAWSQSNPGPTIGGGYDDPGHQEPNMEYDFNAESMRFSFQGKEFAFNDLNAAFTYTGEKITPTITQLLNTNSNSLVQGRDFEVAYSHNDFQDYDNTNTNSSGMFYIYGINEYEGDWITQTFSILPAELNENNTAINLNGSIYNLDSNINAVTPTISSVTYNNKQLQEGADYKVDNISSLTEPGEGTVTISGINNYTGTVNKSFTVRGIPINGPNIEIIVEPKSFIYNGKTQRPTVTIKDGTKTLEEGKDYTFSWSDKESINAKNGYTYTILGEGLYCNGTGGAYSIYKKEITSDMISLQKSEYAYDGKAKEPNVIIKHNNLTLEKDKDFTLEYKNNTNIGNAEVIVQGIGNYKGECTKEFKIVEKGTQTETEPTKPSNNQNESENTDDENEDKDNKIKLTTKYNKISINNTEYICNIKSGTTVEEFTKNLSTNGQVKIYNLKANNTDKNLIKTGMKLEITKGNQKLEYVLVVKGDVTGDGKTNGVDLLKVARYILELDTNLDGAFEIAADVDNEKISNIIIDIKDVLKISKMLASLE